MENENTTGDSELDAIIYGEESVKETPTTANPAEKQTWDAGGRKWDDAGKLAKSYDALVRDYSKTKNELKSLQPWKEFGQHLEKNPQLRDELKKRIDEYHANRQSGMSKGDARQEAGLPKEYVEKIERLEAAHADLMLDKEINSLREKYKLDDDMLRQVLNFSETNDGIPLDMAFKAISYDKSLMDAKANGAKGALEMSRKKQAANVGPSSHGPVAPSKSTPGRLTNEQHQAKLSERLEQLGFKD